MCQQLSFSVNKVSLSSQSGGHTAYVSAFELSKIGNDSSDQVLKWPQITSDIKKKTEKIGPKSDHFIFLFKNL